MEETENSEPVSISLELNSRADEIYQAIRDHHYVANKGTVGRQLHYLIYEESPHNATIGIITGASAVAACKPRDDFFGITKDNRNTRIQNVIDNTVFRLEENHRNLASHVLSVWRKQVVLDWKKQYPQAEAVIGFETFVDGTNPEGQKRNGSIYKADNWEYVGMSAGSAKTHEGGAYTGEMVRTLTSQKLVFCKKI